MLNGIAVKESSHPIRTLFRPRGRCRRGRGRFCRPIQAFRSGRQLQNGREVRVWCRSRRGEVSGGPPILQHRYRCRKAQALAIVTRRARRASTSTRGAELWRTGISVPTGGTGTAGRAHQPICRSGSTAGYSEANLAQGHRRGAGRKPLVLVSGPNGGRACG